MKRFLTFFILAIVALSAFAAGGQDLQLERRPLASPPLITYDGMEYQLTVKFADSLKARAQPGGAVATLSGKAVQGLAVVVDRHGLTFRPEINLAEAELTRLQDRAIARTGRQQPDLAGMMIVDLPDADTASLKKVAEELRALPEVEYVFLQPLAVPPPGDIAPATPDLTANQTYFAADPGMDVDYAWSQGANGSGIRLSDCEYGWNAAHEDLNDIDLHLEAGQTPHPDVAALGWDSHGTAVIGETSAVVNAYGVSGMAPGSPVYTYPEYTVEEGYRRVTSITNAIANSAAGDVVLLEMQTTGVNGAGSYVPAEYDPSVWTVVKAGVDAGVIVVGAAGNGNQDLDSAGYQTYMNRGDSGAILVGAGSANARHDKMTFSTFGSRVNIQGWGQFVFTLGYGDFAAYGGDKNQRYSSSFNGTSSASPFVASACLIVQSGFVAATGTRMTPAGMRAHLIATGLPQEAGGHIGPFPDLRAAIDGIPCPDPVVALSTNLIGFSVPLGGTDGAFFTLSNSSTCGTLNWTLTEQTVPGGGDAAWLVSDVVAGSIPAGTGYNVNVAVNALGLAPGNYTCDLEISSNDPASPLVVVTVTLSVTGTITNATGGVIYATRGFNGTGEFLQIDPVTGAASVIGNTGLGGLPGLSINAQGEMFGVGGPNYSGPLTLYRIDAATGAVVSIGNTGVNFFSAMAFGPNGVLYGTGVTGLGSSNIYTVNTLTGAATMGPALTPEFSGLAFDPTSGILYGTQWNGVSSVNNLYIINPATGAATLVGSLGLGVGLGDINFDQAGNLFGVSGGGRNPNDFVAIDKATGLATIIGSTGFTSITGLASFGSPEMAVSPASLATSVPLGGTAALALSVDNLALPGSPDLAWTITEDAVSGGGDSPWLSLAVYAGSTPAGAATNVGVDFDAFGLAPGVYHCNLQVAGNDPANPLVIVPVELTVTGPVANAVAGIVYGTQGFAGTGQLLSIDPVTGAASSIGSTRVSGMPGLSINGQGEMYGVGGEVYDPRILYRIDAATGAVVTIGSTGVQFFSAMAFSPAGVLHGIAVTGGGVSNMYTVDTATGATVPGPAVVPEISGMAFDPTSGLLYGSEWSQGTAINNLYTIDPGTGAATLVGAMGLGVGIGDIHFDAAGNLFGVSGGGRDPNNYVAIDKNNGLAAIIGSTGFPAITGLTSLGGPAIAVAPAAQATTLSLGGTDTLPFKVFNVAPLGSSVLNWTISEDAVPGGGDCTWLGLSATAGSTAAKDSTGVDVYVDAFGLGAGVYTCNLLIASDDAANPLLVLPVELTVTGSPAQALSGEVYGTQGYNGSGEFLRIDPVTGAATIIGNTRVVGMPGLAINDLGQIYGVGGVGAGDQNLYRIDAATGAVVLIGATGVSCFQAMAFDAAGVLYGIGDCGPDKLYVVDTATGAVTPGPAVNPNMVGLAFDPSSGTLYGVEYNNSSNIDNLYVIDTVTGATTLLGSLGLGVGVGDIHFDSVGNLFGVVGGGASANDYVAIDKNTGAATVIGATGIPSITGIAFAANFAVGVDDKPGLPSAYVLHQAAPNPFNPMTTISFDLPADSEVTISVYDTAGRRVKTIVEGLQRAGAHKVTFNGERLSSGVYFFEMRAGNFREIRKMTLVK